MLKYLTLIIGLFSLCACQKDPGFGGNSTIKGRLEVENYNRDFSILRQTYNPIDEEVFILFGENSAYGDKVRTDTKGFFEFRNLKAGAYTVYAYSKDSAQTNPTGFVPIEIRVEVNTNEEFIDIGTLTTVDNNDRGFATIRGKLYTNDNGGYYVPDERVFLVYPTAFGVETSQRTKYDGTFEFTNLPLGIYEIYAYTDDNQAPAGVTPIIQTVTITDVNQDTLLPDFVIDL